MYLTAEIGRLGITTVYVARLTALSSLMAATQLLAIPQPQADTPATKGSPKGTQQTTARPLSRATKSIKYTNVKYGFSFSLPSTWKEYSTVEGTWSDADSRGPDGDGIVESGPQITIVNPQSTEAKKYQDICIMVFSHVQWDSLQQGNFVVSAASVGPGEIGRNRKYVFAEPPRMVDSDHLYGWEEVVKIMHGNPLHAF